MKDERFLRVKEVAKILCVSSSTVWMYARDGILPKGVKMSPRVTVWLYSDIVKFMKEAVEKGKINGTM